MAGLTWLERAGVGTLGRGAHLWPPVTTPVSHLDAREREELRSVERRAVVRAGVAGAISAGIAAMVTLQVSHLEHTDATMYWLWVGGVGAVTAAFEVTYLYWDALRAVRQMAKVSGVRLYSGQTLDQGVAVSLARAALELPTPRDNPLGVDPHREARRWQLVLIALLYKAKVGLSTFVLKVVLRRVFGRLLARAAFEFVAIPVTALWNVVVCYRVLREARIRAMGPSFAKELAAWVLAPVRDAGGPNAEDLRLIAWALGTSIVKNGFVHPNWVALIVHLELPEKTDGDFGDCPRFLRQLKMAAAPRQRAGLRALLAAAILDGRISRLERQWVEVAFAMTGARTAPLAEMSRACRAFSAGDAFDPTSFGV